MEQTLLEQWGESLSSGTETLDHGLMQATGAGIWWWAAALLAAGVVIYAGGKALKGLGESTGLNSTRLQTNANVHKVANLPYN